MSDAGLHNVLISSAGRRGELVKIFQESQRLAGLDGEVFTVDRSPLTSAGWLSSGLDLVPSLSSPGFIDAVLEVCQRRNVRHVIPTLDPELPLYAAAIDRFREIGVDVWVSNPEAISIAQDKRITNRWLRAQGLPAVAQVDLATALATTETSFPVIAKPAGGSSSVGLVRAARHEDFLALDPALDDVVEEIAPGVEFTVDVLVAPEGSVVAAVPRRRLETRAGEVSKGLTTAAPEVEDVARRVVEALPGARGVLNVQIFQDDSSGSLNVIEINARFGGGFPLSWAAGAQFPMWLMQRLANSDPTASVDWKAETLMLRYDAAVFLDVAPGGVM